jgi:hypothetical protein
MERRAQDAGGAGQSRKGFDVERCHILCLHHDRSRANLAAIN